MKKCEQAAFGVNCITELTAFACVYRLFVSVKMTSRQFAEFFLAKYATQFARHRRTLGPKTLQVFLDYSWPGNIRELENVIKKIVALNDEDLAMAELVADAACRETSAG